MPMTTIPPFADIQKLPACAVGCDALYAANAPCVPPEAPQAAASVYTACFCSQGVLAPLSSTTVGVCDGICDDTGLRSIASWFRGVCSVGNSGNGGNGGNNGNGNGNGNGGNNGGESSTSTDGSQETSSGNTSGGGGGGGDWLSGHWKWVVMIVILVVAIVGIWIGACIWRRRYLKKKDRQTSLGQKHSGSASRPSWGPPVTGSGNFAGTGAVPGDQASDRGSRRLSRGMFNAAPTSSVFEEEKPKEKKKWTVRERT
jgi:hypothetical protein